MNILKVKNLGFSYGNNRVLDKINLTISRGDFVGIVGSNGCGKSTLLKLCLGLVKPSFGTVNMFGEEISKFKNWRNIGYIPQKATSFNQGFPATVEEVVSANLYHKSPLDFIGNKDNKEKINKVLDIVGMKEYKKRLIGKLSGGQQQRIFIAKALISNPKIIFMDEPTVGIDKKSEKLFYQLMGTLNKERDITIVMVTHDISEIGKKANKIINIVDTRLTEIQNTVQCRAENCIEQLVK